MKQFEREQAERSIDRLVEGLALKLVPMAARHVTRHGLDCKLVEDENKGCCTTLSFEQFAKRTVSAIWPRGVDISSEDPDSMRRYLYQKEETWAFRGIYWRAILGIGTKWTSHPGVGPLAWYYCKSVNAMEQKAKKAAVLMAAGYEQSPQAWRALIEKFRQDNERLLASIHSSQFLAASHLLAEGNE